MRRRIFLNGLGALVLAASAAGLGGCGRRSTLKSPEGGTYPREYPTPQATGQPATIPGVLAPPTPEEGESSGPLGTLPPASPPRY